MKYGITSGIGLFIAFVGLKGAGVVVSDDSTLVALGNFGRPEVALCLIGILVIAVMNHYNVKGSILWGILITWVLGIIAQLTGWYVVDPDAGAASLIPSSSRRPSHQLSANLISHGSVLMYLSSLLSYSHSCL